MELIAVTNRSLCKSPADFRQRIAILAKTLTAGDRILLREKDMPPADYTKLAQECQAICRDSAAKLILHTYPAAAQQLGISHVHLPFPLLQQAPEKGTYSTSVHSVGEAVAAEQLGAAFLIAGHVFPTACKKGLPPRGLDFLRSVCGAVSIPVYGIGGITAERAPAVLEAGAAGVCIMSQFMTCDDLPETIQLFKTRA